MKPISCSRHRFPPVIIQHALWLYFRFTLSYRDVENLLAERGIDVSYETVRRWALKFGGYYAQRLRKKRPKPGSTWHIDEVFLKINGKQVYLWRAVDDEGKVLDVLLQSKRDKNAAINSFAKRSSAYRLFSKSSSAISGGRLLRPFELFYPVPCT